MITSLNPKLSAYVAAASAVLMLGIMLYDVNAVLGFFVGMLLAYPLVYEVWKTISRNWKNIFKPFYSKKFYQRKMKIIKKSWMATWWIVPYCLIAYGAITITLMVLFGSFYMLYGLMLGSIFEMFWFLQSNSGKYYRQIRR